MGANMKSGTLEMDGPKALPKLCRVSDVAQACGLSRTTIYKLMKSGDIKATQARGAWRVDRDSVLSYFGL